MANEYIILNDSKQATHKFKEGEGTKDWEQVKDFDNIGLVVPKPFIVLDFDSESDSTIMLEIIKDFDLKCRVMKTSRGIHCWFRSDEPWKCFIKGRLAIGVYADCKSHSKNAYVKIKSDGVKRKWLKKIPMEDIEPVPKWLMPVSSPSDKFQFKGMGEGSGRNQELFNYIVYLQTKGFKKKEVIETINIINDYVFDESLDEQEINSICRDGAFKSDEEIQKQIEAKETKGWSHNEFADKLINMYHILSFNGQLYIYDDGYYQQDERNIERRMIEMYPSIKTSQRTEVLNYIRIKCHAHKMEIQRNPYIINLKNTRLDIRSNKALPFGYENIEFTRFPITYDESAYCADVDKMLNKVFKGDNECIKLFDEALGYILLGNCRYSKFFMCYGSGSNGKSTIFNMIKAFVGASNYTTMSIRQIVARFGAADLENKSLNIGDDIDNRRIEDTSIFKKAITGETMHVERKQEQAFDLRVTAKHFYSCNSIPKTDDLSDGLYRRYIAIPFNAVFNPNDDDFDPDIEDKITTDNALSYLLNRALKGFQRLRRQGKFTEPQIVANALAELKINNSSTLSWLEEKCLDAKECLSRPCAELYSDYSDWCKLSNIKPFEIAGKTNFYKEIIKNFGFEDGSKQRSNGKRYFIVKLD